MAEPQKGSEPRMPPVRGRAQEVEKMQTPTVNIRAEIQKAYFEWDRTYAYDRLGFNPKLF